MLLLDRSSFKGQLLKKNQEIEALSNYLSNVQEKIREYEEERVEEAEIPKTIKIRELLDSYLRDRDQKADLFDTSISTEELRRDLEDYQMKNRFIPNIIPLRGEYTISQGYSQRHKALDLASPLGTEVTAAAAGVVKSVYEDRYFGHVVVIDHLNHYLTFYAHLAKVFPQQGLFVEKGQAIGLVGSSGFSTHSHLHYEIIYRGDNIDPKSVADF